MTMDEKDRMKAITEALREGDAAWNRYLGGSRVIRAIAAAAPGETAPGWLEAVLDAEWAQLRGEMSQSSAEVNRVIRSSQEQPAGDAA
jgi:hypothetical protein